MPLLLDAMRAEFARQLTSQPDARFSMDKALAHVLTRAYEAGVRDGATTYHNEDLVHLANDLLDPERYGWAVTQEVRDQARRALGEMPKLQATDRFPDAGKMVAPSQEPDDFKARMKENARRSNELGYMFPDEAAPVQEPVAFACGDHSAQNNGYLFYEQRGCADCKPLYTTPPDAAAQIAELEEKLRLKLADERIAELVSRNWRFSYCKSPGDIEGDKS